MSPHITDEDIEIAKTTWADHEIEARTKGIPILGSGNVYQFVESRFVVQPFDIPPDWARVYALDPGWRCTAAVFLAKDPKENVYYVFREYKERKKVAAVHAANIKAMLAEGWPMGVCDPSAASSNAGDGQQLLAQYRGLGLNLWRASNTVDSGIIKVQNLLFEGRNQGVFDVRGVPSGVPEVPERPEGADRQEGRSPDGRLALRHYDGRSFARIPPQEGQV